jgi:formyltetrahydrofolate-dependent phosphoribosylglycinamide formyltransferase
MTHARTEPLRVAALLSGGGRTLLNLLDEADAGRLHITVPLVIASRDCAGIRRARQRGLRVEQVSFADHKARGADGERAYSERITALLEEVSTELVVMAGFLSKWIVPQRYLGKVMNIHPALLPSFGGRGMFGHHVHEAVLAHGCKVSGCTVHFVNNEYDAGPIILQRSVPAHDTDTPETLAARVFEQECIAFPEAVRLFAADRLSLDGRVVRIAPD